MLDVKRVKRNFACFLIIALAVFFAAGPVQSFAQDTNIPEEVGQRAKEIVETIVTTTNQIAKDFRETIRGGIKPFNDLLIALEGAGQEWTAELWERVENIAQQAGVAIDELVPSVAGCIRDENGNPLFGVPVLVFSQSLVDITIPTWGITGGGTLEESTGNPSVFVIGAQSFPVLNDFVPDQFEEEFNRGGCFWIPLSPGVIQTLMSVSYGIFSGGWGSEENPETRQLITVKVVPISVGYSIRPLGKLVKIGFDGTVQIENLENPEDLLQTSVRGAPDQVGTAQ